MKRQQEIQEIRKSKRTKLDNKNNATNKQCHEQHPLPINPYFKNNSDQQKDEQIPLNQRLEAKKRASIIYSGIKFDFNSNPIEILKPLNLNELKLIVARKCNIELRSDQVAQAYRKSDKTLTTIQSELDKCQGRTIIRLKNNYPYNLKPQLEHWIAWSKGYTWKDLEQQYYDKKLPFIDTSVFHWINDSRFRSIQSIPHYHIIYERNKRTKTSKMDTNDYTWN
jgi:hypothetical protein